VTHDARSRRLTSKDLAVMLALLAAYFAVGRLSLALATLHVSASAVWPPTGIALAALVLLGRHVWPAIFVGAFLVNLTTQGSVAGSLGIATGNTLEAALGAYLVERFAGGRRVFERAQDIFKFCGLVVLAGSTLSATIGVTTLALIGSAPWIQYKAIWMTWWLGDVAGALIVTPLIVIWAAGPRPRDLGRRWSEAVLLAVGIVAAG
jgi:integral membrane sensor domain MASE1